MDCNDLSIGVQILTNSALNLLRRASGRSEEEEHHADRQKLRDPELEKVIRSEQHRRRYEFISPVSARTQRRRPAWCFPQDRPRIDWQSPPLKPLQLLPHLRRLSRKLLC